MTTDEVLAAFAALPHTTQMRAAAPVLVASTARSRQETGSQRGEATQTSIELWDSSDLRANADEWDHKDAAEADREHLVEGLAMTMATHFVHLDYAYKEQWRNTARAVLERFDITPKEKP